MLIHFQNVNNIITLQSKLISNHRLTDFNKQTLLATLSFSTNSFAMVSLRPSLMWLILSCFSLTYALLKDKNKYFILIAIASFFPLILIIPFIGNIWEDYWGVLYVPLIAIFSIYAFKILDYKTKNYK